MDDFKETLKDPLFLSIMILVIIIFIGFLIKKKSIRKPNTESSFSKRKCYWWCADCEPPKYLRVDCDVLDIITK